MTYLKRASVYKNKTTRKKTNKKTKKTKKTKEKQKTKNKSCINIPLNNTAVVCGACFIYNICH